MSSKFSYTLTDKELQAIRERCETCRFWQQTLALPDDSRFVGGECRRHAPAAYQVFFREKIGKDLFADRQAEVRFPPMGPQEWCGEWQPAPPPAPPKELRQTATGFLLGATVCPPRLQRLCVRAVHALENSWLANGRMEYGPDFSPMERPMLVSDLIAMSADDLLGYPKFGGACLAFVRAALAAHGLALRGESPP